MEVIVRDCRRSHGLVINIVCKIVIPVSFVSACVFPTQFATVVQCLYGFAPGFVKHRVETLIQAFSRPGHHPTASTNSNSTLPKTGGMFTSRELDAAQQMLLVTTEVWSSSQGELKRYERPPGSGAWYQDGRPIQVILGEYGLAWATAEGYKLEGSADPVKRRNDRSSPAGIFSLGEAFGYKDKSQIEGLNYDYTRITSNIFCVDDNYNNKERQDHIRLIDRTRFPGIDKALLRSMSRKDELYRFGVVVKYISPPTNPNLEACLFLHTWDGTETPTSGSTTMGAADLEETIRWLNRNKRPILVQITKRDRPRIPHLPAE